MILVKLSNTQKNLAYFSVGTAVLCLISIFTIDRPLAEWIYHSPIASAAVFVEGTKWLDTFTGQNLFTDKTLRKTFFGGLLLISGGACLLMRFVPAAKALIFVSCVQLTAVLSTGLGKITFGRQRPIELFANGQWDAMWFASSTSFPSGHTSFYWGLFIPLIYLFPQYRLSFLVIPVFIGLARMSESMHFLSDVLASITLAMVVTLVFAVVVERWGKVRPNKKQVHQK